MSLTPPPATKMHHDEALTDADLVRRLLKAQFPQWAGLPLAPVPSAGTDNALYRLGDDMVVRLPRIHWATGQVHREHQWLPRLAPHLPLAIPTPLAMGQPGEGYPWHWSIYRWIEGQTTAFGQLADPQRAAVDLAHFILALQRIDTTGGPPPGSRGGPLRARDTDTRAAIAALHGQLDTEAATRAWEAALQAPDWAGPPLWFHGDLLPGNLLFQNGRLCGLIDFGTMGVGDPACDLMIAWNLFSGESREAFRAALAVDEAMWARGRGWALSQALIFIPYYLRTNPVGVGHARRAVAEVLADFTAWR